jgi:hypothetical protein
MEPISSLPYSQQPDTCLYPKPDQSNPHTPQSYFFKIHFSVILSSLFMSS